MVKIVNTEEVEVPRLEPGQICVDNYDPYFKYEKIEAQRNEFVLSELVL